MATPERQEELKQLRKNAEEVMWIKLNDHAKIQPKLGKAMKGVVRFSTGQPLGKSMLTALFFPPTKTEGGSSFGYAQTVGIASPPPTRPRGGAV